jgi:hypothetical protein
VRILGDEIITLNQDFDFGQRKSPRRQTLAFLDKENPQGADIHILSRIRNLNN